MEATVEDAVWRTSDWEDTKKGKTYAIFRDATKLNKKKTEDQGRPIYDPIVEIEIIVTGDPLLRPVRQMREDDKEKYPVEWARFQQKQQNQIPGTPIEAVTWLSRSQVAEYKALNIYTIEQLAELPDITAKRIMGFSEVREKAQNFLVAARGTALQNQVDSQLKSRDEEIEKLKAHVAQLLAAQSATPQQQAAADRPKKADRQPI